MSETSLPLAILALAGCSYFFAPRVELQRLTLDVAARANDDSPIAVDFVAVKDAELFKELAGLPASQWFANREQVPPRLPAAVRGMEPGAGPGAVHRVGVLPLARRPRNWTFGLRRL